MLKKYFDFGFQKSDLITLFVLIFCCIFVKITGIEEIYENSLLENLQLIPLAFGAILCFKSKNHKVFFRFIALILILACLRELSYGRVIFCTIPDSPHNFYKWSHYKYGWLAHVLIGAYIALSVLYALVNKIWIDVINVIKKVKIPVLTFLISFVAIGFQLYSEKYLHNTIVEETAELLIYCTVLSLVMIYYKKTE